MERMNYPFQLHRNRAHIFIINFSNFEQSCLCKDQQVKDKNSQN